MEVRPLGNAAPEGPATERVRVRAAYPRDLATVVEFGRALALETEERELDPETLRAGVHAVLEDPARGAYFVAEREGTPVGSLFVTSEWSDWRNGLFWWIQSVYVLPEARGEGVFRRLYDHVLEKARVTPGVCGLRLYVMHDNERARKVYEAVGMAECGYRLYEFDFPEGE